jgi:hypothetical protein
MVILATARREQRRPGEAEIMHITLGRSENDDTTRTVGP